MFQWDKRLTLNGHPAWVHRLHRVNGVWASASVGQHLLDSALFVSWLWDPFKWWNLLTRCQSVKWTWLIFLHISTSHNRLELQWCCDLAALVLLWHEMAETANVDQILEKSFDAHTYRETENETKGRPIPKILIQKSRSEKRPFLAVLIQYNWLTYIQINGHTNPCK